MPGMEFRPLRARHSLRLAVLISVLLHGAVLWMEASTNRNAGPQGRSGTALPRAPLVATLSRPKPAAPATPPSPVVPATSIRKSGAAPKKPAAHPILSARNGPWAARAWSREERSDMDKFLNESPTPAPAPRPLSERALAMARQLGRADEQEEAPGAPTANGKPVEPFSLEMYFDAFVRKMNRSAAFVKNDPRAQGHRKALVQISLNPDGSLKSYKVLRAADQQVEIAYIKSVLERAAPFSAFPPDIRGATDALSIQMCIFPPNVNGSSGFSRSFGGNDCKD